jgi:ubiquinone/menaquinone biosynthesis C-methylase UbiE/chromosome segregation ATPase
MMIGQNPMSFTGERYVPGVSGDIESEHLHRYALAAAVAVGRDVLDIASGEGYGSAILAAGARSVVGVDIAADAVLHATKTYSRLSNLRFVEGSCSCIPLPDASVDLVVSFETIEHHDRHEEMMCEIKRVLRPSGVLLISSPDRDHYSVARNYRNPYHVKELDRREFETLIVRHFKRHVLYGQRVAYGSLILAQDQASRAESLTNNGEELTHADGVRAPHYWIALASDGKLPALRNGLFELSIDSNEYVRELVARLASTEARSTLAAEQIGALQLETERMRATIQEYARQTAVLQTQVEAYEQQSQALLAQGRESEARLSEAYAHLATQRDQLVAYEAQSRSYAEQIVEHERQAARFAEREKARQVEAADAYMEIERRGAELSAYAAQTKTISSQIDTYERQAAEFVLREKSLREELSAAYAEIEHRGSGLQAYAAQTKTFSSQIDAYERQTAEFVFREKSLREELSAAYAEIEHRGSALQQYAAQAERLTAMIARHEHALATAYEQIEAQRAKTVGYEQQVAAMSADLQKHADQASQLVARLERAEAELRSAREAIADQGKALTASCAAVQQLEHERDDLDARLEASAMERDDLRARLDALSARRRRELSDRAFLARQLLRALLKRGGVLDGTHSEG